MLPEHIAASLQKTFSKELDARFTEFVRRYQTKKWTIYSDYVLGDKTRPNDTYVFSVMPAGDYLDGLTETILQSAHFDLKDTREISEEMFALLRDPRIFSLCFIIEKPGLLPTDQKPRRKLLENTLSLTEKWENASEMGPVIHKFRGLVQKSKANSFNGRVLDQMFAATVLAAFVTYLLCKNCDAELIGWFSDRDSITTSHQRIANDMFAINVNTFIERYLEGMKIPKLACNDIPEEGGRMWCDAHLRVPDHFAGAISVWKLAEGATVSVSAKYGTLITRALADNPQVMVVRIKTLSDDSTYSVASSQVLFSTRPGVSD